jgi:protein-S-isoprenylcysteine O-methyltransferase Ste14
MITLDIIIFAILSIIFIYFSRHVVLHPNTHGFYRFLSWECIAWLFSGIYRDWFYDPFSWNQIISWIFLVFSLYYIYVAVTLFRKLGKAQKEREDKRLYTFEKTTELIETGLYKFIRHPMYGSLLLLSWGIFLKDINVGGFIVATFSSVFLFITAKMDEKENIAYFGDQYVDYMRRSKMFIPFVF